MNKQKDKCTKGYSCGYSCINTSYTCRQNVQKPLFNKYLALAKLRQSAKTDSLFATLYNDTAKQKYKEVSAKHPEFSQIEALSMSAWVGGKYSVINRHLLGIEQSGWGEAAAKGIESAMRKLPGVTEQSLLQTAKASNAEETGKAKIAQYIKAKSADANAYALTRNIRIAEPEQFLQDNDLQKGKTHKLNHLFATSFDADLSTFAGNIAYKINSPIDGSSNGKAIDDLKTSRWESELLFSRNTEFSIDNVQKALPKQADIALPKLKAKKSQKALADLLSQLDSKSPEELLSMPEPDLSNLSKADAKRVLKVFNALTNYKYTIFMTELIDK